MTKRRIERFWSRVDQRGADECWLWTGGNVSAAGYGLMQGCVRYQKYSFGVHRIAYALANGRDAEGVVMHECDVPLCCNPRHLLDGSYSDNMMDARHKGRPRNKPTKHAPAVRLGAIEMRRDGLSLTEIAAHYGIPWRSVQQWCSKAGLAKVRGPYALRRNMSSLGYAEWSLSQSRRLLDGSEGRSLGRNTGCEQGAAGEAGDAAGVWVASSVGTQAVGEEGSKGDG